MRSYRLTEEERRFAEENHGLLLKFLAEHGLGRDYYTVLIERYLHTAVKYCRSTRLRKLKFSTVLWKNLRSELYDFRRRALRVPIVASWEDCYQPPGTEDEPMDEEFWQELRDRLTGRQNDTILLRDQGYSNREIAGICGVTERAVERRFQRIRKTIRTMNKNK